MTKTDLLELFEYNRWANQRVLESVARLQHVVNHSTYHRGQVTTMLRQLGAQPQATDLALFHRIRTGQDPA